MAHQRTASSSSASLNALLDLALDGTLSASESPDTDDAASRRSSASAAAATGEPRDGDAAEQSQPAEPDEDDADGLEPLPDDVQQRHVELAALAMRGAEVGAAPRSPSPSAGAARAASRGAVGGPTLSRQKTLVSISRSGSEQQIGGVGGAGGMTLSMFRPSFEVLELPATQEPDDAQVLSQAQAQSQALSQAQSQSQTQAEAQTQAQTQSLNLHESSMESDASVLELPADDTDPLCGASEGEQGAPAAWTATSPSSTSQPSDGAGDAPSPSSPPAGAGTAGPGSAFVAGLRFQAIEDVVPMSEADSKAARRSIHKSRSEDSLSNLAWNGTESSPTSSSAATPTARPALFEDGTATDTDTDADSSNPTSADERRHVPTLATQLAVPSIADASAQESPGTPSRRTRRRRGTKDRSEAPFSVTDTEKRREIFTEILESERLYVRDLNTVITVCRASYPSPVPAADSVPAASFLTTPACICSLACSLSLSLSLSPYRLSVTRRYSSRQFASASS